MSNYVHDKIQIALEKRLSTTVDLPDVAWENVDYSPTTGSNFVLPRFVPVESRPAIRGTSPVVRHSGFFRIWCYVPEHSGSSSANSLVSLVMERFPPTLDLEEDGTFVTIEYTERQEGRVESPWYYVPVTIGWYTFA